MKEMKINETSLPQMYSKGLYEEKNYDLAPQHTDKITDILFTAVSELLNVEKKKERPVAFVFERLDGSVLAAAIVEFFENPDPAKPGNWSLVWTFYGKDIPENAIRIGLSNEESHTYFRSIAGDKYGIRFKDPGCLVILMTYIIEQLIKWLDENAVENEVVKIEQDAVFQARVGVEDGEKVFTIEPKGEIKALIKGDAIIEK